MKPIIDTIQILLQTPGLQYPATVVLIWLLLSVIKTVFAAIRQTRIIAGAMFYKLNIWRFVVIIFISIFVVQNVEYLTDALQYAETRAAGIHAGQYASFSESKKVAIYEAALRNKTMPDEYNIITDSIRAWVAEFWMDSTALYECVLCECALNPFVVRQDGIAAGFVQFTNIGCDKMPFTLSDVKKWCYDRNAERMMWATGIYLRYWSRGKKLKTGLDCYLAVFAPAHLGKSMETVLYDSGEAYRLNRGIDGFEIVDGMVVRMPGAVDGKITIQDLFYWMEYKNSNFIKSQLRFKN